MTKATSNGFKGKNCVGRIVMNAEQDNSLGDGWYDTPSECEIGDEPEQDEATQKKRLWNVAEERGIKIDKRWNIEKLIEVIER